MSNYIEQILPSKIDGYGSLSAKHRVPGSIQAFSFNPNAYLEAFSEDESDAQS